MSSKATKVRLVRCPNCWKVLPERADVPVYKCGGCNVTLKAKNHIKDGERTNSEPLGDNLALEDELDHDLEIKSLNNPSSSGETCKQLITEPEDCDKQQCESKRISDEVNSSGDINYHEEQEFSSEAEGDGELLEHNNGGFSNTESQSPDTQEVCGESSPAHTARRPYSTEMQAPTSKSFLNDQSGTSINSASPHQKWTISPQTMTTRRMERPGNYSINSDDDLEDKVKLRGRLKSVGIESPATRNSRALASDSSKIIHQASNYKRLERAEFLQKNYEHFGHLNHRHKDFPSSSSLYATGRLEKFSRNQMELLQKVDELRDQLYRSCALQRRVNETIRDTHAQLEKQCLFHHNLQHCNTSHWQPSGEFRPRQAMTHCRETAFSETGTTWHDCNEHWKCLQKNEPPEIFHGGLRKARPGHMCYNNPYSSVLSSPLRQENLNSRFREFSNEVKKMHHKDRRQVLKRHYHPIAGGAPFLICYRCSKLLHIPGDFLQTSKKYHRLRCGSCSKVLKFSPQRSAHIVPCSRNLVVPPPSKLNNNHAHDIAKGDPVSYYEDYWNSTDQKERGLLSPQIVMVDQLQPSSTYMNLKEDKKKRSVLGYLSVKHKDDFKCIDC